jgi:hypothetical protein
MWLGLSLIAFLLFASVALSTALIVRACRRVLMTEPHDVFSPIPTSRTPQSPRE